VSVIPLADARALAPLVRRTLVVRGMLALLAAGAVVAFLLLSRDPRTQTIVPLPSHADTVLVLDVSASISTGTYARIGSTLAALAHHGGRFGLVVFSDEAYEVLPPGTPSADLEPFVRYFTVSRRGTPAYKETFPPNPWESTFTAGTRISAGLELAHRIAISERRRPTVVLVSDLNDNADDVTRLSSALLAYRRDRVPIRIVGLDPQPSDLAFFRRLIDPVSGAIVQAPLPGTGPPPRNRTPFPWALVALAGTAAAALAGYALWAPRLEWGRG
jgi:hypothetical protein